MFAVVIALVAVGGGWAAADSGSDPGPIHACVNNSNGAVFARPTGATCKATQYPLDWSRTGPAATGACTPAGDPAPLVSNQKAFLSLAGVTGDSADARHANQIDVTGWRWDVGGAACGVSGTTLANLTLTKNVDSASAPLFGAAAQSGTLATGTLAVTKVGTTTDFLTIAMTGIKVTRVQPTTGTAGLAETVTVVPTKATVTFRKQKPDGTYDVPITSCWDDGAHAAC